MKLQPLLEGTWLIKNLDGKVKRFKDDQSPSAIEWKNSRTQKTQRQLDAETRAYWREVDKASKPKKPTLDEIHSKAEDAVSSGFPDGDPIDRLGPWLQKHDLTMDDVDRAFKKHERTTFYGYLGHMWEGMAQDALHDAKRHYHKHGDEPDDPHNGAFWHMGKNGPELNTNPWLSSDEQKKLRAKYKD